MSDTKQTNFAGGELSPLLYGRTDLPVWAKGLRTCENFLITKHGAAMSRPGTYFVNTTKVPTPLNKVDVNAFASPQDLGNGTVRLVGFNVSDNESFVLEFGANYIRLHTLGATVLAGGVPYEVVTPYAETDLPRLKFAQIGEVLTICSPNWDPYELRHIADNPATWSFTAAVTKPIAAGFPIAIPALQTIDPVLDRQPGAGVNPFWQPDADHQAAEWVWKVTMLLKRTDTGETVETLPQTVVNSYDSATGSYTTSVHPLTTDITGNHIVLYSDRPVTVARFQPGPFTASAVAYAFVAMNVYRGRGTLFGLVGTTTTDTFVDVGALPNYDIQPPAGRNPFGDVETANVFTDSSAAQTDLHRQRPNAVCYYQQRRVFGGMHTANREQDLEISALGSFDDYDQHNLIDTPGEALQVTLAARRRGSIRHLVSMRRMLILGSASSYHGGGTSQLPLDFGAMDFPIIEEVGSSEVTPLVVDGSCLFVRSLNRGARALIPARDGFNYEGVDLTWLAEHLFRGLNLGIIDWTHAQDPWDTVWAVRGDGRLVSLTVDRAQEMAAWARHDLNTYDADGNLVDPAIVLSICSVREGDEDAVYMVVLRQVPAGGGPGSGQPPVQVRYIERMTSRHVRGGAQLGPRGAFGYGGVSVPSLAVPPDYVCLDCAQLYVGPAAQVFTGLAHLEGKDVYILAQGSAPEGPLTVANGQVTAGAQYVENVTASDGSKKLVLYIGLRYECTLELLDVAGAEARARWKQVTHVGFEVDQSRGIQAGQDPANLDDAPIRETDDNFDPAALKTEFIWFPVSGTWDQAARMTLKQTAPKPCTVVGVSRRLSVGG